jgi:raffinose/stachyose/melibiose transport system permease protein
MMIAGVITPLISLIVQFQQGWVASAAALSPVAMLVKCVIWILPFLLCLFLMSHDNETRGVWLMVLGTLAVSQVLRVVGLAPLFAATLAVLAAGLLLWLYPAARQWRNFFALKLIQTFTAMAIVFWALGLHSGGDRVLWGGFSVISILVVANIVKLMPSIVTAVVIHRLRSETANYWYRVLFVVPMIIPGMVYLLIWKFFFEPTGIFNMLLEKSGLMTLLAHMDTWFNWGGVFASGNPPAWLGHPDLVLPAFIIWGFPWVGVVGVLIYLAGLQSISSSVYEAADLDGVGAFGKFLHIELPLIMTQVRINLVMLIIGTFQMYGFILILFGDSGGPNGRVMVPDLLMFRKAFTEAEAGYACCIGLIIFAFILVLSELNNRYVRVEK